MAGEAFMWPSILVIGPAIGCTISTGVALVWIAGLLMFEAGGHRTIGDRTVRVLLSWGIFCLAVAAMLIIYAVHEAVFTQRVRI